MIEGTSELSDVNLLENILKHPPVALDVHRLLWFEHVQVLQSLLNCTGKLYCPFVGSIAFSLPNEQVLEIASQNLDLVF